MIHDAMNFYTDIYYWAKIWYMSQWYNSYLWYNLRIDCCMCTLSVCVPWKSVQKANSVTRKYLSFIIKPHLLIHVYALMIQYMSMQCSIHICLSNVWYNNWNDTYIYVHAMFDTMSIRYDLSIPKLLFDTHNQSKTKWNRLGILSNVKGKVKQFKDFLLLIPLSYVTGF